MLFSVLRTPTRKQTLSSLTCLLRTDECNDATQLCALSSCFSDNLLVDRFVFRQVCCALEHAVLKREHLLECVVQERCAEADIVSGVEAHLELARTLLLGRLFVEDLSVLLRLGSVCFGQSCEHKIWVSVA